MLCRTLTCIATGAGWSSNGSSLLFDGDGVILSSFPDGVILHFLCTPCDTKIEKAHCYLRYKCSCYFVCLKQNYVQFDIANYKPI